MLRFNVHAKSMNNRTQKENEMEFHELSTLFPSFEGTMEFEALCSAMKSDGFDPKYPILTWKGKIIDGRHRYLASQQANITPIYRKLSDEASLETALDEVTKANFIRRSMTTAEKAIVAEKMANLAHGGDRTSEQTPNLGLGAISIKDASKKMNVSHGSVESVRNLKKNHPETYEQLEKGEFKTINAAVESTKSTPYRPMKMQKNTAKGTAISYMMINSTMALQFNFDEVGEFLIKNLEETVVGDPRLIPLCKQRAENILNNRPHLEKLYEKLEEFIASLPTTRLQ